jgi:hypothetical protein
MNRNSALMWFPAIKAAGLPVPRTVFVPYDHRACLPIFDGEPSGEFTRLVEAIGKAIIEVGSPVFVRTDLSSAKHSGPQAYRIADSEPIGQAVASTIEDNEMKFWMERSGPKAFMVRQFLDLDAPFTAFSGLPISREWRLFADGEHVICLHPYWPAQALANYVRGVPDWREKLAELHRVPLNIIELGGMAVRAAKVCGGGAWSVDFAQDRAGKWWLIDMAVAKASWHWPGCPEATR